ncbi:hypothetical protein FZI85_29495 [Mycobacterium sp. CBMA293]|uniref:hypothetical protein n=1 Tax=unclassified Mycolicibacterium TaxID=2636767 RepID=UPI0012DFC3CF|nr:MULTISPECIES: hypothetical protein [unclassified Mycolicibacterium]MUL49596.1 hypothetical protein [Mycolicibacterium sp. CBMA 360]MUL61693.1 hypothetical protein [Mycolicibacterium sp. CBMA 335]MUL74429.1 hypothetical protein [Mycolicibacterium sp. CBMA 311]MUL96706.1 hypothetical protein [Mycolicibacterium sp. CBMA 230]MUM04133.1 hypothetical protein [Mycolicibacterium sp. CBMA 213]
MSTLVRLIAVLIIPIVLLVGGCGHKQAATGSNATSSDSIPADPSGDAGDAAPIASTCPAQATTSFAKTKFVAHSGLAFGAFHRWLWKPFEAGTFKKGASGRMSAFIKGGLAALFVKREVRLATTDVQADPTLCKSIIAPLDKLGDTVQASFDKLKGGDASGLTDLNSSIGSIESTSQTDGVPIQENENADLTKKPV